VPHGIEDFKYADGQCIRNHLLAEDERKLILFVGRLTKQKNLHFLLRCFHGIVERFPRARLLVIGEGEDKSSLKEAARRFEIADKIDWIEFVPYPEIAKYFRAADVFVLCSLVEGMPRVLIMAVAAGIPIVSTDVGGVESVIRHDETGFIVPQGDEEEFIEKTLFLLNNARIARKMGRTGQQTFVKELDRRKMLGRQIEIWNKIVGEIGNREDE
jgi:glycosyltransferase involved in cell wall biosynthesis